VEPRRNVNHATGAQLASGTDHRLESVAAERSEEEHLGGRARVALPQESSAEHPGGVEDERIARRDELPQVAKAMVRDPAAGALHHHEPALVARLDGVLGDSVVRKL